MHAPESEHPPLTAVIGLGSNVGNRGRNLRDAVARMEAVSGVAVTAVSRVWETAPVGPPQPRYLNAAVRVRSTLGPEALLEAMLGIERAAGRERRERWGPRPLDLDLLWIEGRTVDTPVLTVPHPELRGRPFALVPLLDVAPDARDPSDGTALSEVASRLPTPSPRAPSPWPPPDDPDSAPDLLLTGLSVAAPAYDEEAVIEQVVDAWRTVLDARPWIAEWEIVVCNDGSHDRTGALLDGLAAADPRIRPVHLPRNEGAGRAMRAAICATRQPWVLLQDADGQFDLACVDSLAATLARTPGARGVLGVRTPKKDTPFGRFGAWATTQALDLAYGAAWEDLSSACQLVDGAWLRAQPLEVRGLHYSVEIAARLLAAQVPIAQTPVPHRARVGGHSHRTRWRTSRDRALFVGYLGLKAWLARMGITAP